ncbi:MAG: dTDP-4-dehydrorhamnose reductase [Magnetococcales bacterium]|nr:dTDP-4-dehydrorhamnose reductase [Magnetococcales bacterium]
MHCLVTGALGQLGRDLTATCPPGLEAMFLGADDLDVADEDEVTAALIRLAPRVVINAAAYTAVDRAESEPERAHAVNAQGPANLARIARILGIRVIHISTDYVFDGRGCRPYRPGDATGPLGVYGASKLAGEQRLLEALGPQQALVIRTAWLHGATGANFPKTILRLLGERDRLRVVADQVGSPTWTRPLAQALWAAVARPQVGGIHHWTDAGAASWYDLAVAVAEEGRALGLVTREVPIDPIPASAYPLPAARPHYSLLDCDATRVALEQPVRHWREGLRGMLSELRGRLPEPPAD